MKSAKKKILFMIPSLTGGGAQRVMVTLVNNLDRRYVEPVLVLVCRGGCMEKEVASDVKTISLNAGKVRYSFRAVLKTIRQERPDIVFSTMGYLNLMLILLRRFIAKKTKLIARESNIVSIKNKEQGWPCVFDYLYKKYYGKFDKIVCQSEDMRHDLRKNYAIKGEKMIVINNPLDQQKIEKALLGDGDLKNAANVVNLLSVGSLKFQKGYDLLFRSLALLPGFEFRLNILGGGELKDKLVSLAESLGIRERICFRGYRENPYVYMKGADLFILSSRYEGFPNVVLEALACGTAVVAFACPGGLKEIIWDKVNGLLVEPESVVEMAAAIVRASKHNFEEAQIISSVTDRFALAAIMDQYEKLFRECR